MAQEQKSIGQIAYENFALGNNYAPPWERVGESIRNLWTRAADTVARAFAPPGAAFPESVYYSLGEQANKSLAQIGYETYIRATHNADADGNISPFSWKDIAEHCPKIRDAWKSVVGDILMAAQVGTDYSDKESKELGAVGSNVPEVMLAMCAVVRETDEVLRSNGECALADRLQDAVGGLRYDIENYANGARIALTKADRMLLQSVRENPDHINVVAPERVTKAFQWQKGAGGTAAIIRSDYRARICRLSVETGSNVRLLAQNGDVLGVVELSVEHR